MQNCEVVLDTRKLGVRIVVLPVGKRFILCSSKSLASPNVIVGILYILNTLSKVYQRMGLKVGKG